MKKETAAVIVSFYAGGAVISGAVAAWRGKRGVDLLKATAFGSLWTGTVATVAYAGYHGVVAITRQNPDDTEYEADEEDVYENEYLDDGEPYALANPGQLDDIINTIPDHKLFEPSKVNGVSFGPVPDPPSYVKQDAT